MKIVAIPEGTKLLDSWQPLDAHAYATVKSIGYEGVGRYVDDLTQTEIEAARSAQVGIFLFKTCRDPGWIPSKIYAEHDAAFVKKHFGELQLPAEAISTFFIDHEGPGGTAQDEIDYINRCYDLLWPEFRGPGLYVGYGTKLGPSALYYRLKVKRYMKSGSQVPVVANRGYCLVQEYPLDVVFKELPGHRFDKDYAQTDLLGGSAHMLVGDNYSANVA